MSKMIGYKIIDVNPVEGNEEFTKLQEFCFSLGIVWCGTGEGLWYPYKKVSRTITVFKYDNDKNNPFSLGVHEPREEDEDFRNLKPISFSEFKRIMRKDTQLVFEFAE